MFGVFAGLGFGMIYLPAIVSVTCYFEKYRSLATGIAVCGSGLGTFIFAPLVEFLVSNYGWQTTVGVISGLVFLCTLFGILFRPLPTDEQYQQQQQRQPLTGDGGGNVTPVVLTIVEPPAECQPLNGDMAQGSQSFDHIPNSDEDGSDWRRLGNSGGGKLLSNQVNTNTFGNDLDKQSRFTLSQPELIVPGSNSRLNAAKNEMCYASQNFKSSHIGNGGIMYQKDIFYSGSLKNLNVNRRRLVVNLNKDYLISIVKILALKNVLIYVLFKI